MAKKDKKIVSEPADKDLKAFQSKYGDQWRQFVNSPAFAAGMQYLRNKKLEEVSGLSPDDVLKFGVQLQSELRGFLQLQDRIFTLPEMQDFTVPFSEEVDYLSPEQEAEQEQLREKFRAETKRQRYVW